MDVEFGERSISFKRVLSVLDEFVIDFVDILDKLNINYVIISGYVPLLFGRQRITEDVDLFLEDLDKGRIKEFYSVLSKKYWLMNAPSFETFVGLFKEKIPVRASRKGEIAPNMEIKQLKTEFDHYSLENSISVKLNNKYPLKISPIEIQIAYKLFLGSKKDLEDARFLFNLFKKNIDMKCLSDFIVRLGVSDKRNCLGEPND